MTSAKRSYANHPAYKVKQEPLVLQTGNDPQISMIWLHGLGDTNINFSHPFRNLPIYKNTSVRFIFPQAPVRPVTFLFNMIATSWYDVLSIKMKEGDIEVSLEDIRESANFVAALVQAELESGIQPHNIFVGGFSQGGAISLETMFLLPQKIGGFLCLSGYLSYKDSQEIQNKKKQKIENKSPIFFSYGAKDIVIPMEMFTESCFILQKCEVPFFTHMYEMGHEICQQEILDINNFLIKKI